MPKCFANNFGGTILGKMLVFVAKDGLFDLSILTWLAKDCWIAAAKRGFEAIPCRLFLDLLQLYLKLISIPICFSQLNVLNKVKISDATLGQNYN